MLRESDTTRPHQLFSFVMERQEFPCFYSEFNAENVAFLLKMHIINRCKDWFSSKHVIVTGDVWKRSHIMLFFRIILSWNLNEMSVICFSWNITRREIKTVLFFVSLGFTALFIAVSFMEWRHLAPLQLFKGLFYRFALYFWHKWHSATL